MEQGYAICLNRWTLDESIKNELRLLLIISSLCAKDGYCYASNKYLAELFNETERNISVKLKKLEEKKYIKIDYDRSGAIITNREIRLIKKSTAIDKNIIRTIDKNIKENNISNIKNININNKEIYKERFEKFYQAYPKHLKKAEVEKWFYKNKPDETLFKTMITQLEKFKKTKEWNQTQYIPYPSTWLNQKRWEDEIKTQEDIDKEILDYLKEMNPDEAE
jgi:hypothetical protein